MKIKILICNNLMFELKNAFINPCLRAYILILKRFKAKKSPIFGVVIFTFRIEKLSNLTKNFLLHNIISETILSTFFYRWLYILLKNFQTNYKC